MTQVVRRRLQFLSRQLIVGIVVVGFIGFLLLAVFPTRTYLKQRHEIQLAEKQVNLLNKANSQLQNRSDQLNQDTEIEKIARQKYNLVNPGEQAYGILPSPGDKPKADITDSSKTTKKPSNWHKFTNFVSFWN